MRQPGWLFLAVAIAGFAAGCAASGPTTRSNSVGTLVLTATQPGDSRQWLPLAQIPGAPVLAPQTEPATGPAPMEAVLLYARARQAELDDRRIDATRLLEQACRLDPDSFELQYSLARMYAAGGQQVAANDDQALAALEAAAQIEPDHLRLQIDLGREYLEKNNVAEAVRHLRLALQTTEYRDDDAQSAIADFLLANGLERQGYLRAALDEFRLLVDRLSSPSMAMRANGELAGLLVHIDACRGQVGELEEKLGEYPEALATFESLLARDPTSLPLSARVVACLLGCNRPADAVAQAARLVVQHPESPEAVKILDEACQGANDLGDRDAVLSGELGRLYLAHPRNRALLLAWIDALQKEGQDRRALHALASAMVSEPYDPELMRRRFAMIRASADPEEGGAAKAGEMLIALVGQYPALAEQVEPLWDELLRPGRVPYLTFAQLRMLAVPGGTGAQEQARQFFIAYAAEAFGRQSAADAALAQANSTGAYAPAAREQLGNIWSAGDLTDVQKAQSSEELAKRAEAEGDKPLAEELRGLSRLDGKDPTAALRNFDSARPASRSPQFLLERALAIRDGGLAVYSGQNRKETFESNMWALISDWPGFGQAYVALLNYYAEHEEDEPARNAVRQWISADPANPLALRIEALQLLNSGRADAAQSILSRLLESDDNDPRVLGAALAVQEQNGPMAPLLDRLDRLAQGDRANVALAGVLADEYAKLHRSADAQRLLDASAAKLADNPDMLYQLSGFYQHVGFSERSEQMLLEVLRLDPTYAGAANDLGYYWADAGENLSRAEGLIRRAVAAEPHNVAFLDSLGWVLYKQGDFSQASTYLQKACTPRESADPTVLNHLGDALYRLGQPKEAAAAWQSAAAKITDADGEELRTLRTQLLHKSQLLQAGQPVDVAPISGAASQPATRAIP